MTLELVTQKIRRTGSGELTVQCGFVYRFLWRRLSRRGLSEVSVDDVESADVTQRCFKFGAIGPCDGGTCPQSECGGGLFHHVDVVQLNAQNIAVTDAQLSCQRHPVRLECRRYFDVPLHRRRHLH